MAKNRYANHLKGACGPKCLYCKDSTEITREMAEYWLTPPNHRIFLDLDKKTELGTLTREESSTLTELFDQIYALDLGFYCRNHECPCCLKHIDRQHFLRNLLKKQQKS